ncbi:unnamed protein product [Ranitomeya imitator]|uniref:Uncharacterized protein n=1 Tax=Ranitomeya imitator TaxID=111125 RepID=A0ABN9M1J1_9NEOB|nr:unnamed protein product [Ranitomeya imitator]
MSGSPGRCTRRSGSKDAVREGPFVTSRSCDRDVTAGPGRTATLTGRPRAAPRRSGHQRAHQGLSNRDMGSDLNSSKSCIEKSNGAPSLPSSAMRPNSGLPPHMGYRRTQDKLYNDFCGPISPVTLGRNCAFLRFVQCRSLAEEYGMDTAKKDDIVSFMENPDNEIVFYLMLRAVDRFHKQHGRYPGVYNYQVEGDFGKLKTCLNGFLQEYGLSLSVKDEYIQEFCRYGAAEPHTIASFLGGAAAQEAIKIITKQFVIFNNTFLYNAMLQTSATFQL